MRFQLWDLRNFPGLAREAIHQVGEPDLVGASFAQNKMICLAILEQGEVIQPDFDRFDFALQSGANEGGAVVQVQLKVCQGGYAPQDDIADPEDECFGCPFNGGADQAAFEAHGVSDEKVDVGFGFIGFRNGSSSGHSTGELERRYRGVLKGKSFSD